MREFPAIFSVICLSLLQINGQQNARFREIRHWKYMNFTWPDFATYQTAIDTNEYIPENILISGIKMFDHFFYITLPRMKNGVPATLARIPIEFNNNEPSPILQPYPSWQMNTINNNDNNNCDNLQNVQNIEIDQNGQLWIIDVGRTQTLFESISRCEPKLIIFNINENRTVIVYQFPEDIAAKNSSFLYDLVIDNTDGGYAYITDNSATDPGIIVYSLNANRSWKVRQHRSMFADQPNFVVNGITITSPINIAGIALSPHINTNNHQQIMINDDRQLYFSSLSSKHLYAINTTILRNENYIKTHHNYDMIINDIGMKLSQSVGMIMDNDGKLYYGLLELNGIGLWDSRHYSNFTNAQQLIGKDPKFIEWPNSFTFDNNGNLIVLINRLNRFIYTKFDMNEINFRLISANLGGKSYIYDDNYNYHQINELMITKTTSRTTIPPPIKQQSSGFDSSIIINCQILIVIVVIDLLINC